jgi:hypothetical protein
MNRLKRPDARTSKIICALHKYVQDYIRAVGDFPSVVWVEPLAKETGMTVREATNALRRAESRGLVDVFTYEVQREFNRKGRRGWQRAKGKKNSYSLSPKGKEWIQVNQGTCKRK